MDEGNHKTIIWHNISLGGEQHKHVLFMLKLNKISLINTKLIYPFALYSLEEQRWRWMRYVTDDRCRLRRGRGRGHSFPHSDHSARTGSGSPAGSGSLARSGGLAGSGGLSDGYGRWRQHGAGTHTEQWRSDQHLHPLPHTPLLTQTHQPVASLWGKSRQYE